MVIEEKPPSHKKTRIISVVAATAIALACGTNYAYSAWAPQFAEKLQLSATESNIIGTAANLGMYASGIPMGIITDRKSPRLAASIGMVALFVGYYPVKVAFDEGPGYMSVPMISLCSFFSGVGSCAAFQAALKTATLNWPTHRGSATACPLAAFGLSAFFYTLVAGIAFPGNTSSLLMLFSLATSLLVLVSIPFLIVVDHRAGTAYTVLPTSERARRDSNVLHRTRSNGSKYSATSIHQQEASTYLATPLLPKPAPLQTPNPTTTYQPLPAPPDEEPDTDTGPSTETSSLLSDPGDLDPEDDAASKKSAHSLHTDVTGLALLREREFWQLWVLLGLLTGVGLMTINNIGHNVLALYTSAPRLTPTPPAVIAHAQLLHVSTISLSSFLGRLTSGIGSDFLTRRSLSRHWCALFSALIFSSAQYLGTRIATPSHLWLVSSLTGLAYGVLFGVFPALVVDAFGAPGFAVNWGFMTLAPVVSGNVYNLWYGAVYDAHSVVEPDGSRACEEGVACYRAAYWVTFESSLAGVVACGAGIWWEWRRRGRVGVGGEVRARRGS